MKLYAVLLSICAILAGVIVWTRYKMNQYSAPSQPSGKREEQEKLARDSGKAAWAAAKRAADNKRIADDYAERVRVAKEKAGRIRAEVESNKKEGGE